MTKTSKKTCPLCGKPTIDAYRPFCSRGCANRDLLSWLGGDYAIAGESASLDELEEDSSEAPSKTYFH